ncbi:MAG TPA: hypothetical protein VFK20_10515, partial [Vicinamibacterales bacterium]|nr:hypothetical protein [Vicinamibacterales bacterium]
MTTTRILLACAALAAAPLPIAAQTPDPQTPAQQTVPVSETRSATTTFMGDTGLWYVPTGEVLPARKFSISAYRVNFDDDQG